MPRIRFHFGDSKVWDAFEDEFHMIMSEIEHEVISDMSKSDFKSWVDNVKHKMASLGAYTGSGDYLEQIQDALQKRIDEFNTPTPEEQKPDREDGKKLYVYDGPVKFEGKERGKLTMYTYAKNWNTALVQLRSKAAKKLRIDKKYTHQVWLDENYLKENK